MAGFDTPVGVRGGRWREEGVTGQQELLTPQTFGLYTLGPVSSRPGSVCVCVYYMCIYILYTNTYFCEVSNIPPKEKISLTSLTYHQLFVKVLFYAHRPLLPPPPTTDLFFSFVLVKCITVLFAYMFSLLNATVICIPFSVVDF